jgi:hypothetical protein
MLASVCRASSGGVGAAASVAVVSGVTVETFCATVVAAAGVIEVGGVVGGVAAVALGAVAGARAGAVGPHAETASTTSAVNPA